MSYASCTLCIADKPMVAVLHASADSSQNDDVRLLIRILTELQTAGWINLKEILAGDCEPEYFNKLLKECDFALMVVEGSLQVL